MLLAHAKDIDILDEDIHSPLSIAAMEGNTECTQILLGHGANCGIIDIDDKTPAELTTDAELSALLLKMMKIQEMNDTSKYSWGLF